MKKYFLIVLFVAFGNCGFSQLEYVKLLVGQSESKVSSYFDSLNKLKYNPAYKIERDVSKKGSLMLSVDFALDDE